MKPFDLTPDPRVLLALTHTAMKPMDALCELVDNAIDSLANVDSVSDGMRVINIDLPTITELNNDRGAIRVSDNGPGMLLDDAQKALTAGYSDKNAYDRLGMFGMGLNIATGKFSRTTRLITATKDAEAAVVVEVDLNKLVQQGHFNVTPTEEPKNKYFRGQESGTIIELSDWWGQGNVNKDFPKKLIQHGTGKIREALGRRYATLLRGEARIPAINIKVKGEDCVAFEHCYWGEHRYIMRGSSRYPAVQKFNEVLREQTRCIDCDQQVDSNVCPVDNFHKIRQVEERIRGWVGVQRFDDTSEFGIDLIRNGRAIRVQEKDAFFNFTDDTGKVIKDYPIDSPYGRIVGEVHLDHVRVDFAKQDFNRATTEWQRAMEFLRGNSSLQPQQPGASENNSPVKKIFDAYRRVREPGYKSMYMGDRPQGGAKPNRVSRDLERDYYARFLKKEEGYYDDAKWWEKVEEAEQPDTSDEFVDCPHCTTFQNPANAEVCGGCGALLLAKKCDNSECAQEIPQSAQICDHCGKSQVPEGPWKCQVCGHKNPPDSEECRQCGKPKGAINALAPEILISKSMLDKGLSVQGLQITLPDGNESTPFDLETRTASLRTDRVSVPVVVFTDPIARKLQVFLDKAHSVFSLLQLRPEHAVAAEASALIRAESMGIMSSAYKDQHNLLSLQGKILDKYWRSELMDNPGQIRVAIDALMEDIRVKMSETMQDLADDIFANMSSSETGEMVLNMKAAGADISRMEELKRSGLFMLHIPPETVISAFREHTGGFFDKKVWDMPWRIPGVSEENVREVQEQTKKEYLNYLDDCIGFLDSRSPASAVCRRAALSLHLLRRKMVV